MAGMGTLLPDGPETGMAANRWKADNGRGDEHVSLQAAGLGRYLTADKCIASGGFTPFAAAQP